ncbi:MAG: helicase-exonuclease AddAB subunit AddB [Lachnospiraceae bacterium]|nr:helicase-exonuclease AddAB subunit AddB [Lachnospiraceae bacterium]
MSLHFYIGSSGSGKSHKLYTEIIEQSLARPTDRFMVIVPEQYNMQTQKELVRLHPRHGIMNIDVLSFVRLAYRVFAEVGERSQLLEEIGKSFVLQKIALDHKKEMSVLGANLTKPGNVEEMKSVISELLLYGISSDMLDGAKKGDSLLDRKLHDITVVYDAFSTYLENRYMTAEEVPDVLARIVDRSDLLRDSIVAFDGFTGFTPVQLRLIERLMPLCREIYVTVTMDAQENPFGRYRQTDLFGMSHEMVTALREIAGRTGVAMASVVRIGAGDGAGNTPSGQQDTNEARFSTSPSLAHLEQNLFRRHRKAWKGDNADISIYAAKNPLAEVQHVAESIARMVREEGLRYRDFAVITGDLATYDDYVRQVFGSLGIPYFLDTKRSVLHNPFVEFVRAAVEACVKDYTYEGIFRMLKTGMSGIALADIDRLENHVLSLGIRGKRRWREKWVSHSMREDPEYVPELDGIRQKVCALLDPMADAFARRGSTVRDKTVALFEFCVRSGCEERLSADAERFAAVGRQDLTREYSQVFSKVMSFLDKLVQVLGDEKISMRDYQSVLEAGFSEEKIGIIPPGTDMVCVGDMERSRLADIKTLFFVGVNEGMVPKSEGAGGILTEAERELLRERDICLKPTPRENIAIGRFYIYLALTKPSRRLVLSYATASSGGQVLRPSYLIATIRQLFPSVRTETEPRDLPSRIERPANGLSLITESLAVLRDQPPTPAFLELFSWYRARPQYYRQMEALLAAAAARKPQDQIGRAAARALYGTQLTNSASRLERFSACAFAHFLQYGLRLSEREQFEFSGLDLGNVMHGALERFGKEVREARDADGAALSWATVGPEVRDQLAAKCVENAALSYNPVLLHDSARNEYQIKRMQRLMKTSVWALQEQLARGDFEPAAFEVDFRDVSDLSAINLDLPDGAKMMLTGRIDRLDTCRADGKTYVKVIDYKTGGMTFDMSAVYYGLQLQLVVYLNAALEMCGRKGEVAEPAGIFYYKINDPMEDYQAGDTEETIRQRILKDMKASGIVSEEPDAIARMDRTLGFGNQKSEVIPVEFKKDGSLSARSKTVDAEGFRMISDYVDRKIREIGVRILEGNVDINPYLYDGGTACDYCPYRAVCGFDRKIRGYEYRNLRKMKDDEVLEKMREDVE